MIEPGQAPGENPVPQQWQVLGSVSYNKYDAKSPTKTSVWGIEKISFQLPDKKVILYDELQEGVSYLGTADDQYQAMMKRIPEIEKQQKEFEDLPTEKRTQMRKTHQEGYDLREISSQPITEFDDYLDQLFLAERFDAVKKTKLPVT